MLLCYFCSYYFYTCYELKCPNSGRRESASIFVPIAFARLCPPRRLRHLYSHRDFDLNLSETLPGSRWIHVPSLVPISADVWPTIRNTHAHNAKYTGWFKKTFNNIFGSVKSFCMKLCTVVGNSFRHISTNFRRFILIFHQMALILYHEYPSFSPCRVLSIH